MYMCVFVCLDHSPKKSHHPRLLPGRCLTRLPLLEASGRVQQHQPRAGRRRSRGRRQQRGEGADAVAHQDLRKR